MKKVITISAVIAAASPVWIASAKASTRIFTETEISAYLNGAPLSPHGLEGIRSYDFSLIERLETAIRSRYGIFLVGADIFISRGTHANRVFYRLDFANLASKDHARALCAAMKIDRCHIINEKTGAVAIEKPLLKLDPKNRTVSPVITTAPPPLPSPDPQSKARSTKSPCADGGSFFACDIPDWARRNSSSVKGSADSESADAKDPARPGWAGSEDSNIAPAEPVPGEGATDHTDPLDPPAIMNPVPSQNTFPSVDAAPTPPPVSPVTPPVIFLPEPSSLGEADQGINDVKEEGAAPSSAPSDLPVDDITPVIPSLPDAESAVDPAMESVVDPETEREVPADHSLDAPAIDGGYSVDEEPAGLLDPAQLESPEIEAPAPGEPTNDGAHLIDIPGLPVYADLLSEGDVHQGSQKNPGVEFAGFLSGYNQRHDFEEFEIAMGDLSGESVNVSETRGSFVQKQRGSAPSFLAALKNAPKDDTVLFHPVPARPIMASVADLPPSSIEGPDTEFGDNVLVADVSVSFDSPDFETSSVGVSGVSGVFDDSVSRAASILKAMFSSPHSKRPSKDDARSLGSASDGLASNTSGNSGFESMGVRSVGIRINESDSLPVGISSVFVDDRWVAALADPFSSLPPQAQKTPRLRPVSRMAAVMTRAKEDIQLAELEKEQEASRNLIESKPGFAERLSRGRASSEGFRVSVLMQEDVAVRIASAASKIDERRRLSSMIPSASSLSDSSRQNEKTTGSVIDSIIEIAQALPSRPGLEPVAESATLPTPAPAQQNTLPSRPQPISDSESGSEHGSASGSIPGFDGRSSSLPLRPAARSGDVEGPDSAARSTQRDVMEILSRPATVRTSDGAQQNGAEDFADHAGSVDSPVGESTIADTSIAPPAQPDFAEMARRLAGSGSVPAPFSEPQQPPVIQQASPPAAVPSGNTRLGMGRPSLRNPASSDTFPDLSSPLHGEASLTQAQPQVQPKTQIQVTPGYQDPQGQPRSLGAIVYDGAGGDFDWVNPNGLAPIPAQNTPNPYASQAGFPGHPASPASPQTDAWGRPLAPAGSPLAGLLGQHSPQSGGQVAGQGIFERSGYAQAIPMVTVADLRIELSYLSRQEDVPQRVTQLRGFLPPVMLTKGRFFAMGTPTAPGTYVVGIQANTLADRDDLVWYMSQVGMPFAMRR